MAKLAKGGFSRTAIEQMQFLIKQPRAEVWEEKKRGAEFPGHKNVKVAMERHLAMLRQNHTAGWLPCQHHNSKNLQTGWRRKGTDAPAPDWRRYQTPELMPPLPETPPTPTADNSRAQCFQIVNLPARYAYSQKSHPCFEFFTLYASVHDSQQDTDFDPDMLTDEGTSTG